jgi:hypothetical protein
MAHANAALQGGPETTGVPVLSGWRSEAEPQEVTEAVRTSTVTSCASALSRSRIQTTSCLDHPEISLPSSAFYPEGINGAVAGGKASPRATPPVSHKKTSRIPKGCEELPLSNR